MLQGASENHLFIISKIWSTTVGFACKWCLRFLKEWVWLSSKRFCNFYTNFARHVPFRFCSALVSTRTVIICQCPPIIQKIPKPKAARVANKRCTHAMPAACAGRTHMMQYQGQRRFDMSSHCFWSFLLQTLNAMEISSVPPHPPHPIPITCDTSGWTELMTPWHRATARCFQFSCAPRCGKSQVSWLRTTCHWQSLQCDGSGSIWLPGFRVLSVVNNTYIT